MNHLCGQSHLRLQTLFPFCKLLKMLRDFYEMILIDLFRVIEILLYASVEENLFIAKKESSTLRICFVFKSQEVMEIFLRKRDF